MELFIGAIVMTTMQYLKKYVKGTLEINVIIILICVIGGIIYYVLERQNITKEVIQIITAAGFFYGLFRGIKKEMLN